MAPEPQHDKDELAATLSIENEDSRVQALLDLAPSLSPQLLNDVLNALPLIQDQASRALAIAGIAPYLDESQVQVGLGLSYNIGGDAARCHAWGALGTRLPENARADLIIHIQSSILNPDDRLRAWVQLAPYLPSELKQEAISTALTLGDEVDRSEALIALAPHLPDVWKLKALNSARAISGTFTRILTLSGLIPALPKKERANALDEALRLARELQVPYDKAVALLTLLPQMPTGLKDDLFIEAFDAAGFIENHQQRVEVRIRLADTQPAENRLYLLHTITSKSVKDIKDEKERGDVLLTLARSGAPELYREILAAAKDIKDPKVKSSVVIQLQSIIEQETASPQTDRPPEPQVIRPEPIHDFPGSSQEPELDEQDNAPANFEGVFQPDEAAVPIPPATPSSIETIKPTPPTSKTRGARKKPLKVEHPVIETPPEAPSPHESVGVKAYLHSDKWTLEDQLNYSLYADAITEFILHKDTKPPLAIGVLAPWGQGKTTLMKLIQNQLETKVKGQAGAHRPGIVAPPITPEVKFAYLRTWLQNPTDYKPEKLEYPTVWFNAWKYQNSEQLWSGMAYSILSQLVSQMSNQVEREKFWLALQAERIDFNAVRSDIHRMVFERIAPWLAIWLLIGIVGLLLIVLGMVAGNFFLGSSGGAALVLSTVMPAVQWFRSRIKVDSKPLEGKFAQYVRQPTYEGKLGFFHEIEMDVQRVFRLLVTEGKPVVVFIDDLDRCSPGTVAQVIEAMNLFLSADFPDCYFIVGMDAQVVAASMEVAYENLDKKLKSVTRSYGSLGWYFMDKFIQLQFSIPNMTPAQRGVYLTKLFGREVEAEEKIPLAELDSVEKQLEANLNLNNVALKPEELPQQAAEVSKLRLQRPEAWQRLSHALIKTSAQQLSDNSPALQKYLDRYEPFLGVSPRGIKRFANLYRFYSLSQLSRQSQGLPACSPSALARWLVIMLRWPQVVRWIQWEGEAKLNMGTSALSKAEALEDQLVKTKTHAAWLNHLKKLDPNYADWMSDRQFYEFLKTPARSDERLSFAVQTGVW